MPNVHFGTFVILCLTLLRSSCYQRVNSMASSGAAHMKKNHLAFSGIFWHRPPKPVWHFLASPKWPSGIFWHCQNGLLAFSGIAKIAFWHFLALAWRQPDRAGKGQTKANQSFWHFLASPRPTLLAFSGIAKMACLVKKIWPNSLCFWRYRS